MSSGVLRPLFVVSVDVKTCFDTINVKKLMRMVKVVLHALHIRSKPNFPVSDNFIRQGLLREDEYLVRHYTAVYADPPEPGHRRKRKRRPDALDDSDIKRVHRVRRVSGDVLGDVSLVNIMVG